MANTGRIADACLLFAVDAGTERLLTAAITGQLYCVRGAERACFGVGGDECERRGIRLGESGVSATASGENWRSGVGERELEAMGMASLNANLAGSLAGLIGSLNVNVPTLPPLPTLERAAVSAASLLAAVMANLMRCGGQSRGAGGIAMLQAKLNAPRAGSIGGIGKRAASAAASASASASLLAQAALPHKWRRPMGLAAWHARSARAMSALVNSLAAMNYPPITMPPLALGNSCSLPRSRTSRRASASIRSAFGRLGNCQRRREG